MTSKSDDKVNTVMEQSAQALRKPTGYAFFMQENSAAMKNADPTLSSGGVFMSLIRAWGALSKEEQKTWNDKAFAFE